MERNDSIYQNIHPDLGIELRSVLHRVEKSHETDKTVHKKVTLYGGVVRYVRLVVVPIRSEKLQDLKLVCFQEESEEMFHSLFDSDAAQISDTRLKQELDRTRAHMQTLLEEMGASNEEMQSLNEELQSSNEELETTNEELQSTNEELHTAYAELQDAYQSKQKETEAHHRTKTALEDANERLELALHAGGLGVCDIHIPMHSDDLWNARFLGIYGYQRDEVPRDAQALRRWFLDRTHPEDREAYLLRFERFARGRRRSSSRSTASPIKTARCAGSNIREGRSSAIVMGGYCG